ncbi:MAG: carbohydrate-binding protein [Terracidiphilus sp.]
MILPAMCATLLFCLASVAYAAEAPYGGIAAAIPGTVQAENYDTGGQGTAYNVTSTNGSGNSYRTDGVDLEVTTDTGGGYDLGWTTTGQWFKYTVNVATAGSYTVTFRVASESAIADAFHIANSAGTNLSGSVAVPDTGGWQTWANVTAKVTLPAGQQTLTINQDGAGWNLNWVLFAAASSGEAPYGGVAAAIPGTVQAENYDTGGSGVGYEVSSTNGTANSYRSDGVDLEATTDTGGGYDLGWSAAGQWFKYTVNVAKAGSYTVTFRVASESAISDALHISNSSGTNLSGSVNVPDTGGWQTWANVTATVTLPAGQQTLTINQDGAGWNLNWILFASAASGEAPYGGVPVAIPGTVQAENYDTGGQGVGYSVTSTNGSANTYRSDGVDLEATTDTGGGYDLGWSAAGQWFKYTVNVATAGTYTVAFRVASESAISDALHISNSSGTNLSGSVAVPDTGGWQTWANVTATVTLPAGQQTLTLNQDNAGWNINYFSIGTVSTSGPRLVGYLPDYDGSYATFATTLNFNKMTHLMIGFALPPACNGTCTASSNMAFSMGQTDAAIATLVNAAHAAGVKVMVTIGGGENSSDDLISAFYNVGLSSQLVNSLDSYVTSHNLDGVDVDFEDPGNMGAPYATFVSDLIAKEHGAGRVVSAAVAEWLQTQNVMSNATLQSYDFINVMVYSNLSDCESNMSYFASLGEPANKMTVGVPFYGQSSDGAFTYGQIIAAYPNAGSSNSVSGNGALDNGNTISYVGDSEMAQETVFSLQYGGIMIWELSQDAAPPNSLLTIIQNNL